MQKATIEIVPPTEEEIEIARQELYAKLDRAKNQPMSKKNSAEEVFAEAWARLYGRV